MKSVKLISILLVAMTAALLPGAGYSQEPASQAYDGQWWLAAPPEEQAGFLNGYLDCYASEPGRPRNYWIENPMAAQPAITAFYQANAGGVGTAVSQAFSRLAERQPGGVRPAAPLESLRSPYDGDYWKQISVLGGPERGQLGFVEGYLACHTDAGHNKGGVFSRTPVEYMALISQWYRFDEYTDEISRKRAHKPIAEVLDKFKD